MPSSEGSIAFSQVAEFFFFIFMLWGTSLAVLIAESFAFLLSWLWGRDTGIYSINETPDVFRVLSSVAILYNSGSALLQ